MEPNENSKNIHLFTACKLRWKRLRTIMNPVFSTAKLREVPMRLYIYNHGFGPHEKY
jgi:hypothetical protein